MIRLFVILSAWAAPVDPLAPAAEYYFHRHDFRQAFALWTEVYKRHPENLTAALRMAELRLMFEGRTAARDTLKAFEETQTESPPETRRLLREKLAALQSTFLTDEGQSAFLQAQAKVRRKDCPGALPLLQQAATAEKNNVKVLKEKAQCEKRVGGYDRYYETLKLAFELNPHDGEIVDPLAEAHVYHRQYEKAAALYGREMPRTSRGKLALGFALLETGNAQASLPLLQSVLDAEKLTGPSPAVLYALGRLYAGRGDSVSEATQYLERFLALIARADVKASEGWDPYRSGERLEETKSLLAALKE